MKQYCNKMFGIFCLITALCKCVFLGWKKSISIGIIPIVTLQMYNVAFIKKEKTKWMWLYGGILVTEILFLLTVSNVCFVLGIVLLWLAAQKNLF